MQYRRGFTLVEVTVVTVTARLAGVSLLENPAGRAEVNCASDGFENVPIMLARSLM